MTEQQLLTINRLSVFLCHRCPYFDHEIKKCVKSPLAYEPLKKQSCHLLNPTQQAILTQYSFIPVSRNVSIKPAVWFNNICFGCGTVVSRTHNHERRKFCRSCQGELRMMKNRSRRRRLHNQQVAFLNVIKESGSVCRLIGDELWDVVRYRIRRQTITIEEEA